MQRWTVFLAIAAVLVIFRIQIRIQSKRLISNWFEINDKYSPVPNSVRFDGFFSYRYVRITATDKDCNKYRIVLRLAPNAMQGFLSEAVCEEIIKLN
ncbi:MAG: hypothetical protein JO142_00785 [Burkholderiales bacterium]|nr:hypothetical protein [Burkholderiales bacterium]